MLNRDVFIVLSSVAPFAVVFPIAGLAGPFLSPERATLLGGVCGFATKLPFLVSGMVILEICIRRTEQGAY